MSERQVTARVDEFVGQFAGRLTDILKRAVIAVGIFVDVKAYKAGIAHYEHELRQKREAWRRDRRLPDTATN